MSEHAYLHRSQQRKGTVWGFVCGRILPRIVAGFPRAGGRVKGRGAPVGGAGGALDAATREWIMGVRGRMADDVR